MPARIYLDSNQERAIEFAWNTGESMNIAAKRIGITRSLAYRTVQDLGLEPRRCPKHPRGGYNKLAAVPNNGIPLVKELFEIMRRERCSMSRLAKLVGISREAIGNWRQGVGNPKLANVDAAFGALGYELTIRKIDE